MILPGCMMPDGGDPCEAFKELTAQRDAWKAAAEAWVDFDESPEWAADIEAPGWESDLIHALANKARALSDAARNLEEGK